MKTPIWLGSANLYRQSLSLLAALLSKYHLPSAPSLLWLLPENRQSPLLIVAEHQRYSNWHGSSLDQPQRRTAFMPSRCGDFFYRAVKALSLGDSVHVEIMIRLLAGKSKIDKINTFENIIIALFRVIDIDICLWLLFVHRRKICGQ